MRYYRTTWCNIRVIRDRHHCPRFRGVRGLRFLFAISHLTAVADDRVLRPEIHWIGNTARYRIAKTTASRPSPLRRWCYRKFCRSNPDNPHLHHQPPRELTRNTVSTDRDNTLLNEVSARQNVSTLRGGVKSHKCRQNGKGISRECPIRPRWAEGKSRLIIGQSRRQLRRRRKFGHRWLLSRSARIRKKLD